MQIKLKTTRKRFPKPVDLCHSSTCCRADKTYFTKVRPNSKVENRVGHRMIWLLFERLEMRFLVLPAESVFFSFDWSLLHCQPPRTTLRVLLPRGWEDNYLSPVIVPKDQTLSISSSPSYLFIYPPPPPPVVSVLMTDTLLCPCR